MPIYTDRDNWELAIILPDETTPVLGGTPEWNEDLMISGFSNIPAAQLANRTLFLYNQIQEILGKPAITDDPSALKKAANLSDLSDALEAKTNLGIDRVDNTSDMDKPISTATGAALDTKVDKEAGKGLSENNFTNQYKARIDSLPEDFGDSISSVAEEFDSTVLMSAALPQTLNMYSGTGGTHGADWPVVSQSNVKWVVETFGDAQSGSQAAKLSGGNISYQRTKTAGTYNAWARVVTDLSFVEKAKLQTKVGGAGQSITVNPAEGSVHIVTLTTGALLVNMEAPRQIGDQVTLCINMQGGAWPLTFGSTIKTPKSAPASYSSGDYVTLVLQCMREGIWHLYYSGVHVA